MKVLQKQAISQIIAVAFQFIFLSANGQENYVPGYITDLNGDTIKGLINYKNWNKNPDIIYFKKETTDPGTSYNPLNIRCFSVLDEMYISAVVDIETSPVLTAKLKPDPELHFAKDTTFLQTMIDGQKSIYYLKDRTGKSHFYIRDSTFQLLIFKRYFKVVNGKNGVAENRNFLGQLTNYLSDCPDIRKKIVKTEYDKISLEKLFVSCYGSASYNNQKNLEPESITFQKKTEKPKTKFGLLGGMTSTSIKFESVIHENLTKSDFQPSQRLTGGVFLDIILPRLQDKWSVCNEMTLTGYLFKGDFLDFETNERHTMYHSTIGFSYLNMNHMVRFTYPVKKFHVFANTGISYGRIIRSKNFLKKEIKYYSDDIVEIDEALNYVRPFEQRFNAGIGARLSNISCEFRYEIGNGVASTIQLSSTTQRLYFILGYRFN